MVTHSPPLRIIWTLRNPPRLPRRRLGGEGAVPAKVKEIPVRVRERPVPRPRIQKMIELNLQIRVTDHVAHNVKDAVTDVVT